MRTNMVDAGPARAHVLQLVADGMRQADICRAAHVTGSALQILLHGHYTPSRTAQRTIHATTEARLLAVAFKAPPLTVGMVEGPCAPGDRFEPVGYRVGRCKDCGQLAPIRRRLHYGEVYEQLIGHPRPNEEA